LRDIAKLGPYVYLKKLAPKIDDGLDLNQTNLAGFYGTA
jgi:hypothetical protein